MGDDVARLGAARVVDHRGGRDEGCGCGEEEGEGEDVGLALSLYISTRLWWWAARGWIIGDWLSNVTFRKHSWNVKL